MAKSNIEKNERIAKADLRLIRQKSLKTSRLEDSKQIYY